MSAAAASVTCALAIVLLLADGAYAQTKTSDSTVKPQRTPSGSLTTTPRTPPRTQPDGTRDLVTEPRTRTPPVRESPTSTERPPEPAEPVESTPAASATPPALSGVDVAEAPVAKAASSSRPELIVASQDVAESDAQRAWLQSQGAQLLRRRSLAHLGWVITVYRLAPGTVLAAIKAELEQQWPDAMPEANERYFGLAGTSAKPVEYAEALIRWPPAGCMRRPRIAMLDGPVNARAAALSGARLESVAFTPAADEPNYNHGTSVAAILVGNGVVRGLIPKAELLVGIVMVDERGKTYTTTEWILRGLDWVLGLSPPPIALNLSFGGPRSDQLARAVERVLVVTRVIAAAGNDGKREAVFPAAYAGVVSVSAVDARSRRWPGANTGEHISIAAPGVDVWTINGTGDGYYASGTSFATAFVTAAIAVSTPARAQLVDWLSRHSRDVGAPGRDPDYGYGVLTLNEGCSP